MPEHKVALETIGHRGVATVAAYERLQEALGPGSMGEIDAEGIVEVTVKDAKDFDEALGRVWNAMATAGADDAFCFAEHPDIPQHWHRDSRPADGLPGSLG